MGHAVKCILVKEQQLLLVKQVKDNDDLWIFPGGKLDEGESPADCVKREMKEELGIDVEIVEKIGEIDNTWQGRRDLLNCFVCRVKDDKISFYRKKRDWNMQFEYSMDRKKAEKMRKKDFSIKQKSCTMCGKLCSMKEMDEVI